MRRTLIYKQTHEGDPGENGCFGIHDCMGRLRNLNHEAVIGVGGIGRDAKRSGIAGKVTWIGIGPRRTSVPNLRGDLVTFDQFLYRGRDGPELRIEAPMLAGRMYSKNAPRFLFDGFDLHEQAEIEKLLALADRKPRSRRRVVSPGTQAQCRCGGV